MRKIHIVLLFVLLVVVAVALFIFPTVTASAATASISALIPYVVTPVYDNYITGTPVRATCDCTLTFSYRTSSDGQWISNSITVLSIFADFHDDTSWIFTFYSTVNNPYPQLYFTKNGTARYWPTGSTSYTVKVDSVVVQSSYDNLGVSSSETYTISCLKSALSPIPPAVVVELVRPAQLVGDDYNEPMLDSLYHVNLYNISDTTVIYSLQIYIDDLWTDLGYDFYSDDSTYIVIMQPGIYRVSAYLSSIDDTIYSSTFVVEDNLGYVPYIKGYVSGYDVGYADGLAAAPDILPSLVFAVPDTIIGMLIGTYDTNPYSPTYHSYTGGLFNFTLFGYDMRDFIVSLVCIVIIVKLIGLVLGGSGKE